MKPIIECFLAALLVLVPAGAMAQAQQQVRVVVFGDSLTSGYQLQPDESFTARLDRKIKEVGFSNVEVVNMSVTGETTAEGAARLNSLVLAHPDVVVLELGTNDAMRGIQTNLIQKNLTDIVEKLKELNAYIVLVGTKAPTNVGLGYAQQLDEVYRHLATFYRLPYYPDVLEGVRGHQNLSMADGLHPNPQGVDVMVSRLYPYIDTGLRWKVQLLQYQQQYQQYQQQQQQSAP